MKYFYINIILILLIVVLIYTVNNKNENFTSCDIAVSNMNKQIEQNLQEEQPNYANVNYDLQQLVNLEEQCNLYYKQQQDTMYNDTLKVQEKQKNYISQQRKQIEEYKKLLTFLRDVYNEDNIAVSTCVKNNNQNIDTDRQALNNLGSLVSPNKLEIKLKK